MPGTQQLREQELLELQLPCIAVVAREQELLEQQQRGKDAWIAAVAIARADGPDRSSCGSKS